MSLNADTGALTITSAGDIVSAGVVTLTGAGDISTAGDITTSGAAVIFINDLKIYSMKILEKQSDLFYLLLP